MNFAKQKWSRIGSFTFDFPFTTIFSILGIVLLYRASFSGFNHVVLLLVGEDSLFKTTALVASILSVVFWEILTYRKPYIFRLIKEKVKRSFFLKLDNGYIRFWLIAISVNYLFTLNVLEYQALATQILSSFGILAVYPILSDLRTTLLGISCPEVVNVGDYISCGDRGNNWTYPSILLSLRALSINQNTAIPIIFLTLLLLTVVLHLLLRKVSFGHFILLISLLNLPPFLLVAERGNLDIFIFTIILSVILLLKDTQTNRYILILCAALISFAGLLKFYPLIGVLPLAYLSMRKVIHFRRSTITFIVALAFVTLLLLIGDLPLLMQNEVIDLSGSTGLGNLVALAIGLDNTKLVSFAGSLFILVLIIAVFHKKLWAATAFYSELSMTMRIQLLLTSLIVTAPWIITTNYYYRLILLWPLIFCITKFSTQNSHSSINLIVLVPTFLSYVLVFRTFAIVQNILLIPIYLLAIFFVTRELGEIHSQSKFRRSQFPL